MHVIVTLILKLVNTFRHDGREMYFTQLTPCLSTCENPLKFNADSLGRRCVASMQANEATTANNVEATARIYNRYSDTDPKPAQ